MDALPTVPDTVGFTLVPRRAVPKTLSGASGTSSCPTLPEWPHLVPTALKELWLELNARLQSIWTESYHPGASVLRGKEV
jgi:hypothetical protein